MKTGGKLIMKKAISLLLALAVILGLSSIAFAATDIPGTYGTDMENLEYGSYSLGELSGPSTASLRILGATPGVTDIVAIPAGELFLVHNKKVVGTETELRPDEDYKFDIYYAKNAISDTEADILNAANPLARKLTAADVGKGTVKIRTLKGSSVIQTAKIRTVGNGTTRTYQVEVETRANYGTKITDVEYALTVNNSDTSNIFVESIHTFTVGFNTISDSDTDVGEDGVLTISNDAPVVLKDQFSDIAKSANYRNVIIEGEDGNWSWKGKVAGMKDTNFSYNYDPDTDLLNKFPDQEFKFLNFPAGVNFPTTGEMRIDVSDVSEDFRTMHAYLYRDGKLTKINGTYDSGADELIFRTNYLGRFIITDMEITDTSLIPEMEEPEEPYEPAPEAPSNNYNPGTGSADGSVNILVTLGLISLAGAVISRKRK
jgi:hypothetical protein